MRKLSLRLVSRLKEKRQSPSGKTRLNERLGGSNLSKQARPRSLMLWPQARPGCKKQRPNVRKASLIRML